MLISAGPVCVINSPRGQRPSPVVGVTVVFATVTGDDDVASLKTDAGVSPRSQVRITAVTGEANKLPWELQTVSLGDPAGPADVPAGALLVTLAHGLAGQVV